MIRAALRFFRPSVNAALAMLIVIAALVSLILRESRDYERLKAQQQRGVRFNGVVIGGQP